MSYGSGQSKASTALVRILRASKAGPVLGVLFLFALSCATAKPPTADESTCPGNEACHSDVQDMITENVYGTITMPDGSPAQGVCVKLFDDLGREIYWDKSDENGNYQLTDMAEGVYRLKIRASNGACNIEGRVRIKHGFNHRLDVRLLIP